MPYLPLETSPVGNTQRWRSIRITQGTWLNAKKAAQSKASFLVASRSRSNFVIPPVRQERRDVLTAISHATKFPVQGLHGVLRRGHGYPPVENVRASLTKPCDFDNPALYRRSLLLQGQLVKLTEYCTHRTDAPTAVRSTHPRYPFGLTPVILLNVAEKWLRFLNPQRRAISATGRFGSSLSSTRARSSRCDST